MHWPCTPHSLSPTRTCQSQLRVYIVIFPQCYVIAEKSTSRGELAICQPSRRHVAGWKRGNWYCRAASKIQQMMSLLVIFVESICNFAVLLWVSCVWNITDMDCTKSTSIYLNNLIKRRCPIQPKNKMKNSVSIGLLLLKDGSVCCFVF
jgi:hypothetical protein